MEHSFAYGADIGWLSQLEASGVVWQDKAGTITDPLQLLKETGVDAIRLRIFVNPPQPARWEKRDKAVCMLGFSDTRGVLGMAKRVSQEGFRLMIDFHYSDHFADPEYQDIPEEWLKDSYEELLAHVYSHTYDFLMMLKANGITPEWVQVGNEINPGILLPVGGKVEHFDQLAGILNRGYDAVKAVDKSIKVITHLADGYDEELFTSYFDRFLTEYSGKTDVIGMSFYPYWVKDKSGDPFARFVQNLNHMCTRYGKDVMICEIGEREENDEEAYALIQAAIAALKEIPDHRGLGIFYWEPEANSAHLPDGYPLGASKVVCGKVLQFNKALQAYRDAKK